jgi:NADH dehydrogenase (ubiquinone) Fe-S protein 8
MLARSSQAVLASLAHASASRHSATLPQTTVQAIRQLSSTSRVRFATPADKLPVGSEPENPGNKPAKNVLSEHSFGQKGPPLGSGMASAGDEPGKVKSYSEGPSALEKAVNLFFLTEIVRGTYLCFWSFFWTWLTNVSL